MRLRDFFLIGGVAAMAGTASAADQPSLSQLLTEIPKCALGCLLTYIPPSTCSTTNLTCVCTNVPLQANLSTCIQGACNFTEQIKVSEVNQITCAGIPIDFNGWPVIIVGLVMGILTLITVLLRCYSRYTVAQGFWWDDWGIIAAMVLLIATVFVSTFNCMMGYGRHFWNIGPDQIVALLKLFWSGELLYNASLVMTRVSILLFYLRVFQAPWFRKVTIATIVFVIVTGLAFNFAILFQCTPISGAWDWTISRSQCINLNAMAYANAGLGIMQDMVILSLPIPDLLHLQMSNLKKLNLMLLFSLGGLAVITSIVRLKFIVMFGDSMDPTWDNIIPSTWSILEISIAMICNCLPSIRALLTRWFPSVFATISRRAGTDYNLGTGNSWDVSRNRKISSLHKGTYSSDITDRKDRSMFKLTSVEEASSSSENITDFSTNKNEGRQGYGHGQSIPKRSDEITFFQVGENAEPLSTFNKNQISKQVVVSVHSTPIDLPSKGEKKMRFGKGSR